MLYWEPSVWGAACHGEILLFVFKYVLQNIIVQGTVIYIYRLVVHLRKILTKQPTAFASMGRDCHPVGSIQDTTASSHAQYKIVESFIFKKVRLFLGFSPSI